MSPPSDRQASVARNSARKLLADATVLGSGLVMGLLSARLLGPAGKGVLSAVLFAAALSSQTATLGLGDSAMILAGRGQFNIRSIARASVLLVAATSAVAALVFIGVWAVQFPVQWDTYPAAIIAGAFLIPIGTGIYFATALLNAEERFVLTSTVNAAVAAATLGGFAVVSVLAGPSVLAAVASGVVSAGIGFGILVMGVFRSGRGDTARFLAPGLRLGLPIQVSHLLVSMSQRLDQLLVFSFAGPAAAGQYSVALTLGQLIVYVPFALSTASFPRIAQLTQSDVPGFVARLFRVSVASMLLISPLMVLGIIVGTPILFGREYEAATAPALILMLGGGLWISQWVLARALAARGSSLPLLQSFGASLLVMVICNRTLVPHWGLVGAAIASTSGAGVGFALALGATLRSFRGRVSLTQLRPTRKDLGDILGVRMRMNPR